LPHGLLDQRSLPGLGSLPGDKISVPAQVREQASQRTFCSENALRLSLERGIVADVSPERAFDRLPVGPL
jgi:hypothetical protein